TASPGRPRTASTSVRPSAKRLTRSRTSRRGGRASRGASVTEAVRLETAAPVLPADGHQGDVAGDALGGRPAASWGERAARAPPSEIRRRAGDRPERPAAVGARDRLDQPDRVGVPRAPEQLV